MNGIRQHLLISGITILLTVWIFLALSYIFDKQVEKDYPALDTGDIFVEKKTLDKRNSEGDIKENLREFMMQQFLQQGFAGFVSKPYEGSEDDVHITTWDNAFSGDLIVEAIPETTDQLDLYISDFLASYNDTEYQIHKKPFLVDEDTYQSRSGINLFTDVQDLHDMGYRVVSHRARVNKDAEYRRHNISTALKEFGSVRVVQPGEELSFIDEINYDPAEQELYRKGFTVVLDEDQTEYGGGLCGASTALYQGLLTNKAVKPAEWRVHSQRYDDLYIAEINGERITTPGIDSTIYDGHIDYKIHNTATYPIIVVANYNGERGGVEEVFSLAKTQDRGSFEHDYTWKNSAFVVQEGVRKQVLGGCYGRIINGEERESCYKQVNGQTR